MPMYVLYIELYILVSGVTSSRSSAGYAHAMYAAQYCMCERVPGSEVTIYDFLHWSAVFAVGQYNKP
jgi:hypothetical protein